MTLSYAALDDRGVLALGGEDARSWLQGLVSNDIRKLAPERSLYATMLTPQGKFLFDFVIVEQAGRLWLDTETARLPDLKKRLGFYKLRSKVTIEEASADWAVVAAAGEGAPLALGLDPPLPGVARAFAGGIATVDPRLAALGCRIVAPRPGLASALEAAGFAGGLDYDAHRLALGVPDGSRDMAPDSAFLLESNVEELNGVDFDKGCYVGQETTTRTKRRGVVRKRLLPVESAGALPPPGSIIMLGDKEAGEMRSSRGGRGLALMRLEFLDESKADHDGFTVGDAKLRVRWPNWI
jgi:folate-binding protein YgfZ